ncbi:MAG: hypothetical protein ASARMPREDX12_007757 [Alectoria sarmentosa]|nr:MAG: hypothetical protein ASARMPREDX12_007757 [Alectoria sarmentosa]
MPWIRNNFQVDHDEKTVTIRYAPGGTKVETTAIGEQLESARQNASFALLRQWRGELYQVLGIGRDVRLARGGIALFGIRTTYPGMLDNTVGGAMVAGEDEVACMVREAEKEASLPEGLTRARARPVGAIFLLLHER